MKTEHLTKARLEKELGITIAQPIQPVWVTKEWLAKMVAEWKQELANNP